MIETLKAAEAHLAELADDPRGVAARLLADGARMATSFDAAGDVAESCPVALWLLARTGSRWAVCQDFATSLDIPRRHQTPRSVDLPGPVGAFVAAFDGGAHRELQGGPADA